MPAGRPRYSSGGFTPRAFLGLQPCQHRLPVLEILLHQITLHFVQPQAQLGGPDIVLRVTQRCNDRNPQGLEKSHQRLIDHRIALDAIGDHPDAIFIAPDLCDQQEVGDAFRTGMNIDIRRQYREDDGVGALGHVRHVLRHYRGRSIDHDMRCIRRNAHLPRSSHAGVAFESCDSVDERLLGLALLQPSGARALRVVIRQQRTITLARKITGEICGYRRFTRTTLRIQDENSLHVGSSLRSPKHHSKGVIRLTVGAPALTYTRAQWSGCYKFSTNSMTPSAHCGSAAWGWPPKSAWRWPGCSASAPLARRSRRTPNFP